MSEKRHNSQEITQLPSRKRRRLILKQEQAVTQQVYETLAGVSYQSGIGHDEEVDIEQLPDPIPCGVFKQVLPNGPLTYIEVSLETTDLLRGDEILHIIQIAAVEMSAGATLSTSTLFKKFPSHQLQKMLPKLLW